MAKAPISRADAVKRPERATVGFVICCKDLLGVFVRLYLWEHGSNASGFIDQVRHAEDSHVLSAVHALLAPGTVSGDDFLVCISQKRKRKFEFLGKRFVRLLSVDGDTQDGNAQLLELCKMIAERTGLLRTTGCIVLRVEVQHHLLAAIIL